MTRGDQRLGKERDVEAPFEQTHAVLGSRAQPRNHAQVRTQGHQSAAHPPHHGAQHGREAHRHAGRVRARAFAGEVLQGLGALDQGTDVGHHRRSGRRRPYASAAAVEQLHAVLALETLERL
ncbi:hypothetical protein [Nocardioides sp.]|uniref:hypothetical protein n=1 Tax=Nocardioides sp. TaxID=35761 RepID=UPI0025CCF519|nr:hypothetical protein [Nocardioides sp.]